MAAVIGARVDHVTQESSNIRLLADFYKEMFGFEEIDTPNFPNLKVIWLRLPSGFVLHLVEKNPFDKVAIATASRSLEPSTISASRHICFTVSNFDSLIETLKAKRIDYHRTSLPNRAVKQVFFFDLDGNGLEVASRDD